MFHGVLLALFGLHGIIGDGVGADGHGFSGVKEEFFGFIGSDKFPHGFVFQQLDILHRVAGDKAVLADHDREMDSGILGDGKCLQIIVVGLLIVFRVDLDPSSVAGAHAVRVVTVDVDGAGQGPVHQSQDQGKAV